MVMFPSRSIQQKMGIEREAEQATNGVTDYANRSYLKLHTRGVQESRKEYYILQSIC